MCAHAVLSGESVQRHALAVSDADFLRDRVVQFRQTASVGAHAHRRSIGGLSTDSRRRSRSAHERRTGPPRLLRLLLLLREGDYFARTAKYFTVVGSTPFAIASSRRASLMGLRRSSSPNITPSASPQSGHCESLGRHRVLVLYTGWGLWRAAIAFHEGPDAEMAYVRHEFEEAFCRHLDSGPRKEDEAWFASTQNRRRAEALAFELAAIDTEPRDSKFEAVFVVHAL